jgi:hypothetical protein
MKLDPGETWSDESREFAFACDASGRITAVDDRCELDDSNKRIKSLHAELLRVPRVHPEVNEPSNIAQRPLDPSRAPILVVEDNRKTIFIYERYLAMAGFQVLPARTIHDAEQLLKTVQPAAIVLDVMLDAETSWVTNRESKARAQDRRDHGQRVLRLS